MRFQFQSSKASLYFFLYILLIFLTHLPFLNADPHVHIALNSVDAFTDEGLYSCQLRNFINHGYLNIKESDGLLKAPLFNIVLALPLFVFGTHLYIARLAILVTGIFLLYYV